MLQGEIWGGPSCRQTRLPRDRTPPAACVGRRNRLVCQSRGARRRSRATRARAPQRGSASHARAAPRFVWSRVRSARIEAPQHTEESGTLYQQRALCSTLALLLAVVKHKPGVYDARRGTTDPTHPARGGERSALKWFAFSSARCHVANSPPACTVGLARPSAVELPFAPTADSCTRGCPACPASLVELSLYGRLHISELCPPS